MTPEQCYLQDVLTTLVENAKEVKARVGAQPEKANPVQLAFEQGRVLAYYEVLSTLIHQADIFGLSQEVMPILSFDPDKELI